MSSLVHDLSISATIVSGALAAVALAIVAAEWIIRGSVDPVIGPMTVLIIGAFVASVTGRQITQQVASGQPILPVNGTKAHDNDSGGAGHGTT